MQGHSDPIMVCDTLSFPDALSVYHTNFDISNPKYKRYAPDTIFLKTRSEVKVIMNRNGM